MRDARARNLRIWGRYRSSRLTIREVAREFGVSKSTAGRAVLEPLPGFRLDPRTGLLVKSA